MVNTRSTGTGSGQQGQNNQGTDQPLPMPPPLTPEQFFQLQMQMMAILNNTIQTLQQIHAQPPPPPPQQLRDRRADFLRGHPPTFCHAADPLQADDWLRSVECQLDVAQCDDRERVLYAAGVTVPVLVMLDILIVSVKYVFVSVKLVCLCEAFENLKCK
jgi:hypothetical protein